MKTFIALMLVAACLTGLSGCFFYQALPPLANVKNLTINPQTELLTWDAVEESTEYHVFLNEDEKHIARRPEFPLDSLSAGTYSITVSAYNLRTSRVSKKLSASVTYTVAPFLYEYDFESEYFIFEETFREAVMASKITPKRFHAWKNNMDAVYEALEDLTGYTPILGEKLHMLVETLRIEGAVAATAGRYIYWNTSDVPYSLKDINYGSWSYTALHEIGHIFTDRGWWFSPEFWANFYAFYIAETLDADIFEPFPSTHYNFPANAEIKNYLYTQACGAYAYNELLPFYSVAYEHGRSGIDLYVYGLLRKTGWNTFKEVFRTYFDTDFNATLPKIYTDIWNPYYNDNYYVIRFREFLHRFAFVYGDGSILTSLKDGGALLETYYKIKPEWLPA